MTESPIILVNDFPVRIGLATYRNDHIARSCNAKTTAAAAGFSGQLWDFDFTARSRPACV